MKKSSVFNNVFDYVLVILLVFLLRVTLANFIHGFKYNDKIYKKSVFLL